jgi:adhesin HecA-like repeat protein
VNADQVSHLTSDIVWMESQQVRLPDGSIDTVLAPKVYLAHLGDGAVTAGGALVTAGGAGVSINVDGDIVNRGGVIDGGNGRTLLVSGQDILNQGGTIRGGDVLLSAAGDVRNESLASTQTYSSVNTSGSYTALPIRRRSWPPATCKSAPAATSPMWQDTSAPPMPALLPAAMSISMHWQQAARTSRRSARTRRTT